MKRIIGATVVAVALLFTGACGGNDEPRPEKTVYVQEDEQNEGGSNGDSQVRSADEEEFLNDVAEHMTPELHDNSQEQVLALGYAICESIEAGNTFEQTLDAARGGNITEEDVIVIAASASVNLCPDVDFGLEDSVGGNDTITG